MKEVKNENVRNFELGSQENLSTPTYKIIVFQKREKQAPQNLIPCVDYQLLVLSVESGVKNILIVLYC